MPRSGYYLALLLGSLTPAIVHAASAPRPPRNTDESKVGAYVLPELLVAKDGRRIATPAQWRDMRRGELLADFATSTYGRTPALPFRVRAQTLATRTDAVDGLATRTLVELRLFDDPAASKITLMLYVPNAARGPVPALLGLNYFGHTSVEADPTLPLTDQWQRPMADMGIVKNRQTEATRGKHASRWPLALALRRGYAVATYFYGDLEPDHLEGWRDGLRGYLMKKEGRTERAPDEWGAIGVWAWGLSRSLDYLLTLPAIDGKRVAVFGHSRHGKTALWAGAQDERFAAVYSNDSGEGGASLGRRNFGETVADSVGVNPFWYCPNYASYVGRAEARPVDQHMLIALAAPRPLYVASATLDLGADPRGEFLSAVHAAPAYTLYGLTGLGTETMPPPDTPVGKRLGYHVRTGAHDITAYDWEQTLNFLDHEVAGKR
ncbi:MAG: acetylxylan esterase [Verrucomicrobia bacterium]|nr:acetylxylan esterase [Verrucomicrobiota bacterium]